MTTIVLNQNYITEAVELIEASLPADNNFSEADDAYFISSVEEIISNHVVLHVIDSYSDFTFMLKTANTKRPFGITMTTMVTDIRLHWNSIC